MNSSQPSTGRSLAAEAAVCVLLVMLFYHPLLVLTSIQSGGDFSNLFWPVKVFIREALLDGGIIPLWNFHSFLGVPLHASLQHALFYPPERLVYTLFPAHAGLNLLNLLHLVIAATGMWAWLRIGLALPAIPAIACGALFPCTAWFWGQQEHINQLAAIAWMPWALLLWWRWLREETSTRVFLLAITMLSAWQFLAGHPQEAVYSHLLSMALVLGWVAVSKNRLADLMRIVPVGIALGIVAGLLVGLQLLPTLELSSHSRRQFPDPTYALSFSMPPDLFLTYLSPHWFGSFVDGYFVRGADGLPLLDGAGQPVWDRRAYGEYGLFIGVPTLLLALLGIAVSRRKLVTWLVVVIVAAWLLALGGNTAPSRLLSGDFTEFPQPGWSVHEMFLLLFPPAKGFRVPARIVILATFALVTLAALGYTWLLSHTPRERRTLVAVAIGAALLLALYLPSRKEKFHHPVDIRPSLQFRDLAGRDGDTLDQRLFRLTMADDGRLVAERHRETTFAHGNPVLERMIALQPHMNILQGVSIVDGYEEGLAPTARYKDFVYEFNRNLRQFRPDPLFLSLLGVSHVYTDLPIDSESYPLDRDLSIEGRAIHSNPMARGAAFWKGAVDGIDFARLDGPFWRGGEPNPEIQREAVSYGDAPNWNAGDEWTPLTTRIETPNRVIVRVEGNELPEGDALLSLGWFPGWEVNGEPLEWISAVHARLPAELVAPLPDGVQGWIVQYKPFSWRAGLFLTALGMILWGGMLGYRKNLKAR